MIDELFQILKIAGPVSVVLGVVCYIIYRMYLSEKKENTRLNQMIIDLLKDHSEDQRKDQKTMINTVNSQTNAMKSLIYFLKHGKEKRKEAGNSEETE